MPNSLKVEWRSRFALRGVALLSLLLAIPPAGSAARMQDQEGALLEVGKTIQGELVVLELGKPVEREIRGGQAHDYQLTMTAGQFVRVVVGQQGVDVALRLWGNNSKLAEVDSPNGKNGLEEFSFVATISGAYRVQVSPADAKAAPGRYKAELVELHLATEVDQQRAAADQALREGLALYAQGKAEGYQQAGAKFETALSLFGSVADKRGQARSLGLLAENYSALGDRNKVLEYTKPATALWRELGDQREEAEALNTTGASYLMLGDQTKAIEYFNQALPLFQSVGDKGEAGVVTNNIAASYSRLGETQKALEFYLRALGPIRESKNPDNECSVVSNIAGQYFQLGDHEAGRQYMEQALPVCRLTKNKRKESTVQSKLGFYYLILNDLPKATEAFRQALAMDQTTGYQVGQINALIGLGRIFYLSGDFVQAREHFTQALKLSQAANLRTGIEDASFLLGTVAYALGEHDQAFTFFTRALELSRAVAEKSSEANALRMLATVERAQGQLASARAHLESALEIIETERRRVNAPDQRSSFFASRQEFYELYIDILMREHQANPGGGYAVMALQAAERSRARTLLDMLGEARADIRQGVAPDLLERERRIQHQLAQKADELTRELSRQSSEEQRTAVQKELAKLRTEYSEVQAQIRAQSPRYAALTQPVPLNLEEVRQQTLDRDTLLLEYSLGRERSYLWAVTTDSFAVYELPKRAELETAARRVYELLTARGVNVKFETVAEKRARVAQADDEYRHQTTLLSQTLLGPVAGLLDHERLLIVGEGALQYLPFAALPTPQDPRSLASSSATGDQPALVARHEVVILPSASTLAVLRRELAGRKAAPKTAVVLADPVFSVDDERFKQASKKNSKATDDTVLAQAHTRDAENIVLNELTRAAHDVNPDGNLNLARLPFTRREAETIAALLPSSQRKAALDFAANRVTASSDELRQYRIVHFATHGFLNSTHPELSGLVFSLVDEQGKPQDGFLRSHEIFNLKLAADLVVLSGCRTGLGKEIRGEGLIGLTRAFMYAGAARVMVSLWDVNDEATAELMKRFYGGLLGRSKMSPAAALRSAQMSMSQDKRWSSPYYWASFTLQGEPR